jgi:hypothetical protein
MARRKAAAAGVDVAFHTADVADLGFLSGGFDYALDIGCLFTLAPADRRPYAEGLGRLVAGSGRYMLYAWLPRPWKGKTMGIRPEEVEDLLGAAFERERLVVGKEKGHPSAWYEYRRR